MPHGACENKIQSRVTIFVLIDPARFFSPKTSTQNTRSTMRKTMTIALAAALISATALPVLAQGADVAEGEAACRADYKKLCEGVRPGGGRIIACLKKQGDKLSPNCKQFLDSQK
jgi:hypothetical protein